MKSFTSKSVEKLLQSLNNDPRLQALDDSTPLYLVMSSTHPIAFDALIMRIKGPITLTTTVDTLRESEVEEVVLGSSYRIPRRFTPALLTAVH